MIDMNFRQNPSVNWTAENSVLAQGEFGYETDTKRFKIGDGRTAWNDISDYYEKAGSGGGLDEAAVQALIDGAENPLIYAGYFSQSGTDAPTVVELKNTIGEIVWWYTNPGNYCGILAGAFPEKKVSQTTSFIDSSGTSYYDIRSGGDDSRIILSAFSALGGSLKADDVLNNTFIKIEVYKETL